MPVGFVPVVLSESESWITEAIGPRGALRCYDSPVSSYVRQVMSMPHQLFRSPSKLCAGSRSGIQMAEPLPRYRDQRRRTLPNLAAGSAGHRLYPRIGPEDDARSRVAETIAASRHASFSSSLCFMASRRDRKFAAQIFRNTGKILRRF